MKSLKQWLWIVWAKVLSFFQASSRTVGLCSLVALLIAIAIFPIWHQIFTAHDQSVQLNYGWNRLNQAIVASVLSWASMTILFISTTHLWQQKTNSRFSTISYIFLLSVAVSGFWMLVLYPGILSYDALNHWGQALNNQYNAWWPPILAMGMHVTQYWAKDPSLFTFIQGVLFWSASLYLLWLLVQKGRFFLFNASVFILIPPLWLYSNAAVSNTWMASFIILSAAFLLQSSRQTSRSFFLASVLSLSLAVCFRREAIFLAIVPIAVYLYCFPIPRQLPKILLQAGTVVVTVLALTTIPSKLITLSPNVSGQSPTGYVFLSQYVGTLSNTQSLQRSQLAAERRSINRKFGPGTFDEMLEAYNCSSSQATILYFKQNSFRGKPKQSILFRNTDFILKKVAETALRHPKAYLQHKVCNFSHTLQIPKITYQTWGIIDKGPDRDRFNLQFDSRLPKVKTFYAATLQNLVRHPVFSLFFRHYIFLTCSVGFLVFGALTRRPEFAIPSLFSVIYPIGLIIPDSFPHWRYLLVCYVLAWICLLGAGNLLVMQVWQWWRRQQSTAM